MVRCYYSRTIITDLAGSATLKLTPPLSKQQSEEGRRQGCRIHIKQGDITFLDPPDHIFVRFAFSRFFLQNRAASRFTPYRCLTSCKKSKRSYDRLLRKSPDRRTDGHGSIYRTNLQSRWVQKSLSDYKMVVLMRGGVINRFWTHRLWR